MDRRFALRFSASVMLFGATCAASVTDRPELKPLPRELPGSWSLEEIAKQTPPYGDGRVYVLAWKIIEDDRPLRVESCLVLKILGKKEGCSLTHLYRHPMGKEPEWQLSHTHVSGEWGTKFFPGLWLMHSKRFKEKPGNKGVYAALGFEEVNWSFKKENGWKLIDCKVCEESWQEAIGERPTEFFDR